MPKRWSSNRSRRDSIVGQPRSSTASVIPVAASVVGKDFVDQYYNVLRQSPHSVHQFYTDESRLSRANGIVDTVVSQRGIPMSLDFGEFRAEIAEIKTIDSQESLNGSVLVMVTGALFSHSRVKRNFVQTFFLTPQKKGSFILNDMFRYLDGDLQSIGPLPPLANGVPDPPTPLAALPKKGDSTPDFLYNLRSTGDAAFDSRFLNLDSHENVSRTASVGICMRGDDTDSNLFVDIEQVNEAAKGRLSPATPIKNLDTSASSPRTSSVDENDRPFEDSIKYLDGIEVISFADVDVPSRDRRVESSSAGTPFPYGDRRRRLFEAEEYDAQRREEAQIREEALNHLEIARHLTAEETRKHHEAIAALENARREAEVAQQQTVEDTTVFEEALMIALEEVEIARQEAAAERRRCEEALASFEMARKDLEAEVQLRRHAEEKAHEEAIAKKEAIVALQRAQKRYTEYTFEELQEATNNFSEDMKLGEGGCGAVYRGTIHHTTVAIKVLRHEGLQGHQEFQREVELLSHFHHPHMVLLVGACPERACIVYEYMANGSLEDRLFCKDGTPSIPWYVRFRICSEVAIALLFLHSSRPEPIIHRDVKPGNILLDHNLVSKVSDAGLARLVPNNTAYCVTSYPDMLPVGTLAYMDPEYQHSGTYGPCSDVYALGIVMLQILAGRPAAGLLDLMEEAVDGGKFHEVLDWSAGEWPLVEAMQLACLGLRCAEPRRRDRPDLEEEVLGVLENIQKAAEAAVANEVRGRLSVSGGEHTIPSFFFCPISQEVMENPHVAADGFTYEYEVIKSWLDGHNTSPMTNLALSHKNLIPNYSLRSAIHEWQARRGRV